MRIRKMSTCNQLDLETLDLNWLCPNASRDTDQGVAEYMLVTEANFTDSARPKHGFSEFRENSAAMATTCAEWIHATWWIICKQWCCYSSSACEWYSLAGWLWEFPKCVSRIPKLNCPMLRFHDRRGVKLIILFFYGPLCNISSIRFFFYHSGMYNENFTGFLIQVGYGFLTVFVFWYHSGPYTMQEPSYLFTLP